MSHWNNLPQLRLGVYPTPFYRLENISRIYNKSIWIKRDDLCGVALGGNKVRKLEYLLADRPEAGLRHRVHHRRGQSNHAMLTAACAARLGLRCVLILKKRGVTDRKGNLVLDDIFGAQVEFMDTDSYEDIYAEMRERCEVLANQGHKGYITPWAAPRHWLHRLRRVRPGTGGAGQGGRDRDQPCGLRHWLRRHHRRSGAGYLPVSPAGQGHRSGRGYRPL